MCVVTAAFCITNIGGLIMNDHTAPLFLRVSDTRWRVDFLFRMLCGLPVTGGSSIDDPIDELAAAAQSHPDETDEALMHLMRALPVPHRVHARRDVDSVLAAVAWERIYWALQETHIADLLPRAVALLGKYTRRLRRIIPQLFREHQEWKWAQEPKDRASFAPAYLNAA